MRVVVLLGAGCRSAVCYVLSVLVVVIIIMIIIVRFSRSCQQPVNRAAAKRSVTEVTF